MILIFKIWMGVSLLSSTTYTKSVSTKGQMSIPSYFKPEYEIIDLPSSPSLVRNLIVVFYTVFLRNTKREPKGIYLKENGSLKRCLTLKHPKIR